MKRLLLLLMLAAPAVLAQGTLEIIPLRHRTVDQVLPVLRPLRQRQVIQTPGGPVVQESAVIQGASTGFEVVPRLSGGKVFLEIAPQRDNFAPGNSGAIQSDRVASSVSARSDSGILSSREKTVTGNRRIWVKVEEVP